MKKPDFDQNNNSADNDQNPVGVGSRKFRHMRKIHAIPPGDKRQWEKDCGYYGENPHGAVLSGVNLRLLHFTNLQGIFPKHLGMIIEPFDPRMHTEKKSDILLPEKSDWNSLPDPHRNQTAADNKNAGSEVVCGCA